MNTLTLVVKQGLMGAVIVELNGVTDTDAIQDLKMALCSNPESIAMFRSVMIVTASQLGCQMLPNNVTALYRVETNIELLETNSLVYKKRAGYITSITQIAA